MAAVESDRETTLPDARRAPMIMLLLGLFAILNFGDKAVLGLAGPNIREDLGLSHTDLGTIASSFYLLFSISCLLVGLFSHRLPATWLLAGLAGVWAVAQMPILIPAAGFGALIVTRVILGAGEGPALPIATHVAYTWYPAGRRTWVSGVLSMSGALGVILGGPFLAAVIAIFGWRAAFGVLGVLGLVWAGFWITLGGLGPYAAADPADTPSDAAALTPEDSARGLAPAGVRLTRIARTPTWIAAVISGFSVQYVLGMALSWLPTYLQEEVGYTETIAGFLVALPSLVALCAVPLAVLGSRKLLSGSRRHPALGYGRLGLVFAGVPALAMGGMIAGTRGPALLVCIALAFGTGIALIPVVAAAIGDLVPVGRRGAALAMATAVSSLGAVVSPWVTGRLLDVMPSETAGFATAFMIAAGLLLVGGAALLFVHPVRDAAWLGGPRQARTGGSRS